MIELRPDEDDEACDFCGESDPQRGFPCKPFEIAPGNLSIGDWLACDRCAALVDENRFEELALRAFNLYVANNPNEDQRGVLKTFRAIHAQFRKFRLPEGRDTPILK